MQYILTEEEMQDFEADHQKEITSLRAVTANMASELSGLRHKLSCMTSRAEKPVSLNIGTYDFQTAKIITRQLKKIRKNKNISPYNRQIKGVRQRGRGTRKFADLPYRLDQSLPLNRAEKVAIYIDCI